MATSAYFDKISETDAQVSYRCGSDPDHMTLEVVIDKVTGSVVPTPEPGRLALKAATKALKMFRERGEWPDKGASIS